MTYPTRIAARHVKAGDTITTASHSGQLISVRRMNGDDGAEIMFINNGDKTAAAIELKFADGHRALVHPATIMERR
jgi:hypothetical protein